MSLDKVAILGGTGALGFGLAVRLAAAGIPVVIGSRDPERAALAVAELQSIVPDAVAESGENAVAAKAATRLVVLAVPLASQIATVKSVAGELGDQHIVMDTTVPLAPAIGGRPTQVVGLWAGSAAQQAAAHLPPHVGVVSGLHTLSAATLKDLDIDLAQSTLLCGDRKADKEYVAGLIGQVKGLQVVDAGPLATSRLVEGITPVLIGINMRYKTHAGVAITGLPS